MPERREQLLQVDDALIRYLDALLSEIPEAPPDGDAAAGTASPVPEALPPAPQPAAQEPHAAPALAESTDIFKGLLFEVGGVTLAAPLDRLAGIVEWSGELNTVPGTPRHVLGLLSHQGRNVRVVDAGRLIVSGDEAMREAPAGGYVVLLANSEFGLACDQVREMVDVDPAEVRWRRGNVRRSWFAGIISERMCALLDIDGLTQFLSRQG